MGKQAVRSRKFGAPLYSVAWPSGNIIYMAGGGGKKGHGIKNRVVAATVTGQELSDEVASLELEDCPIRMAAHPNGKHLLCALGSGGLCRVDIAAESGQPPQLSLSTGEDVVPLGKLPVAKCLAFSSDGRLLALGGEDGTLTVLEWPSLRTRASLTGVNGLPDGVRDLDFSTAHHNKVLAVVCEDGSCTLWDWEHGLQLVKLELPPVRLHAIRLDGILQHNHIVPRLLAAAAGDVERGKPRVPGHMARGSFNRCRFARNGSLALHTAVNAAGTGHLFQWEQNLEGDVMLRQKKSAVDAAITAFDIGCNSEHLAIGTTEGEVQAYSAKTLSRLRREKQAHMVFTTALAMSPTGDAFVSVSADASACVTSVRRPKKRRLLPGGLLIQLLLVMLAVIAYYILQVRGVRNLEDVKQLVRELQAPYDRSL